MSSPAWVRRGALVIAFADVVRHLIRSILVAQGMIWGVALAVVPAALLEGSRSRALWRARELGTDRVEVVAAAAGGERGRRSPPDSCWGARFYARFWCRCWPGSRP